MELVHGESVVQENTEILHCDRRKNRIFAELDRVESAETADIFIICLVPTSMTCLRECHCSAVECCQLEVVNTVVLVGNVSQSCSIECEKNRPKNIILVKLHRQLGVVH